jgi:predicted transcriptional regulator
MDIDLTPEEEEQLAAIAKHEGTDEKAVVKALVARRIEEEARFLAAVQEGIASADRGELIPHEQVMAEMELLFASRAC